MPSENQPDPGDQHGTTARHDPGDRCDPSTERRRPHPTPPGTRWWLAVVRGRSMLPTLADGDRLLVRRGTARAAPGRVAVVRLPGGRPISVKRLARRDGTGWWVERDNPTEGVDSRLVGAIPDTAVLGVVLVRLWPRPRRL